MVYQLATAGLFCYHCKRKPRIRASFRELYCQKFKLICLWGPFLIGVFYVNILTYEVAVPLFRYSKKWIDVLKENSAMYSCSDEALRLDVDDLWVKHRASSYGFFVIILLTVGVSFFTVVLQYCGHYNMMVRWFSENPTDGHLVARAIKVGLLIDQVVSKAGVEVGAVVPEADREVCLISTAVAKSFMVPGIVPQGQGGQLEQSEQDRHEIYSSVILSQI